jgi:hypothetical protein
MRFDNILIRKTEELEILFLDWTLGQPGSKRDDNDAQTHPMGKYKSFILQLKKILQYDGKVNCTFMIAAPEYYV